VLGHGGDQVVGAVAQEGGRLARTRGAQRADHSFALDDRTAERVLVEDVSIDNVNLAREVRACRVARERGGSMAVCERVTDDLPTEPASCADDEDPHPSPDSGRAPMMNRPQRIAALQGEAHDRLSRSNALERASACDEGRHAHDR
jgi:hypothetical protein